MALTCPLPAEIRPVLLPQVYLLHYDPYTRRERGLEQVPQRQLMDFVVLPVTAFGVVLEIDGQLHYGDANGQGRNQASAPKYATMAREDRRLRLSGYEAYRFGGAEFQDVEPSGRVGPEVTSMLVDFFHSLFQRHGIRAA